MHAAQIENLLSFDQWIYRLVNQDLVSDKLDVLFVSISNQHNWYPIYILLALFLLRRKPSLLIALVAGLAITDFSIDQLWKPLFQRPRPCWDFEGVRQLVGCGRFGFFSAHAANCTCFAVVFWDLGKGLFWKTTLVFTVFLICYSRVYVGVHYPLSLIHI